MLGKRHHLLLLLLQRRPHSVCPPLAAGQSSAAHRLSPPSQSRPPLSTSSCITTARPREGQRSTISTATVQTQERAQHLPAGLYVVGTPIGNMGDITLRALSILKSVDCIACEDTRTTSKLLHRYDIKPERLVSYVESRGREARVFSQAHSAKLLDMLKSGGSVALVSESGMPVVSDPGSILVARCHEIGVRVFTVPGPSASLAALSLSGFAGDRFLFEGFLPRKRSRRMRVLQELSTQDRTVVLFENPGRVRETLEDVCQVFGPGRLVAVCREMTKQFESTVVMPVGMLLQSGDMEHEERAEGDETAQEGGIVSRGEHVIVIQGHG